MNGKYAHRLVSVTMAFAVIGAELLTRDSHAATCPFDDGTASLAVEGLILNRYALGLRGAALVAETGFAVTDAPTIESTLSCQNCGLNITGNATITTTDATIISRKLAGYSGNALTAGLDLGTGTRNQAALVQSFLLAGCSTLPTTCAAGQVLKSDGAGGWTCAPGHTTFTHRVIASGVGENICANSGGQVSHLNHALLNDNPNAIVMVTANQGIWGASGVNAYVASPKRPVTVFYSNADWGPECANRWVVSTVDGTTVEPLVTGQKFNVMITIP